MKFENLKFRSLRIAETLTFVKILLTYLVPVETLNSKLAQLVGGLAITMADLEHALKSPSYTIESKRVKAADENRDNKFMFFKKMTEALTHSSDVEIAEAAALIYNELRKSGRIHTLKLDEETALLIALDRLFTDHPSFHQALTITGVAIHWNQVMEAQQEFLNAYIEVSKLLSSEENHQSATELSLKATSQCSEIFELIEALNLTAPKQEYEVLIAQINHEIDKLNQQVRTRKTAAKNGKEEAAATE